MPESPSTVADIRSAALTPLEAAEALGVHRQTVYTMLHRGDLRGYKVGRQIRIPAAEVAAMVGVEIEEAGRAS